MLGRPNLPGAPKLEPYPVPPPTWLDCRKAPYAAGWPGPLYQNRRIARYFYASLESRAGVVPNTGEALFGRRGRCSVCVPTIWWPESLQCGGWASVPWPFSPDLYGTFARTCSVQSTPGGTRTPDYPVLETGVLPAELRTPRKCTPLHRQNGHKGIPRR